MAGGIGMSFAETNLTGRLLNSFYYLLILKKPNNIILLELAIV